MHRYWNIVENKCCVYGKAVYRPALSLGGINDSPPQAWWLVIEASDEKTHGASSWRYMRRKKERPVRTRGYGVQLRLEAMELC